ncbi:unnamed protein product [Symbiodinium microadriaticum]|nr:unnamed protein product [Symbiodinium microadriaticum]
MSHREARRVYQDAKKRAPSGGATYDPAAMVVVKRWLTIAIERSVQHQCALFDRGEIPEHVHSAILPSLTFWHLECLASVDAADSGFQPSVPSDLSFSVYGDEVAPGNPVDPLWRLTADKRRIVFDISAREFEECLRLVQNTRIFGASLVKGRSPTEVAQDDVRGIVYTISIGIKEILEELGCTVYSPNTDNKARWWLPNPSRVGALPRPNGDVHERDLQGGLRHGNGTYTCPSSNVYERDYQDGRKHGWGTKGKGKDNGRAVKLSDRTKAWLLMDSEE